MISDIQKVVDNLHDRHRFILEYLRVDKRKLLTDLRTAIDNTVSILVGAFNKNAIKVSISLDDTLRDFNVPANDFSVILLNLLLNSIDSLATAKTPHRQISH